VVRYGAVELDLQSEPCLADDEAMRSASCPWCSRAGYSPPSRMPRCIDGGQQQLAQRRANLATPDQGLLSPVTHHGPERDAWRDLQLFNRQVDQWPN
jgi:hypothetical protein